MKLPAIHSRMRFGARNSGRYLMSVKLRRPQRHSEHLHAVFVYSYEECLLLYLVPDLLLTLRSVHTLILSWSRNTLHFMEPEGLITCLKLSATYPYPETDQSSPYPPSHFLKILLNIILPSTPGSSKLSLPPRFPLLTLYIPLVSAIRITFPALFILLDFITRKILCEQYRSFSSSLCSFLHSPVTWALLDPNILLSTIFSNTPSISQRKRPSFKPIQNNRPNYISVCFNLHIFG